MFKCLGVWGSGFRLQGFGVLRFWGFRVFGCFWCTCLVFRVFWVCEVMTFWKVNRVTKEGAPKWPKFRVG